MSRLYILYSPSLDRYYIGSTTDLERRLTDHNRGNTKSTKSGRPWECVFSKECQTLAEARALERKLKSYKSRNVLEKIVHQGFMLLK